MDEFLKVWYGFYPKWVDEHCFEYQMGRYVIQDCYMDEKQLRFWLEVNQQMMQRLNIGGYLPVKNLNGQIVSQGKVIFLIQCEAFYLEDLWKQHGIIVSAGRSLMDLRERWIEKIEFVSRRYLYEVDCHQEDYSFRMALIQFYIGMAKTAVSVLNDLIYDYPAPLPMTQLCHRRISKLTPKYGMNPMNFMIDHPARDLCELYMHQLIDFNELCACFERFCYQGQEMHYFFARSLFPSWFFDKIESNYFTNQKDDFDDQSLLNQYAFSVQAIQEAYGYISQRIRLKPLEW